MNKHLKQWASDEESLTNARNRLCLAGASREQVLASYDQDQQANNRRYDGIMRQRAGKMTTLGLK